VLAVNTYIVVFLFCGFAFGMVSFPVRHLFSEGPTKTDVSEVTSFLDGRIFWALVCTCLWPIMLLTGLNSVRILAKRRSSNLG
jgi:hypothetical protein